MNCFAAPDESFACRARRVARVLTDVLKDYNAEGFFDEMVAETGKVRRHYQKFAQRFNALGPE